MSTRLNNQLSVTRLISGACFPVFILLCIFHHFIHAADQATAGNIHPLQGPTLAKGVLLVAANKLRDPNFEKTIVLITEFDDRGTAGLVINRRTNISVAELLPDLKEMVPALEHLYLGGPVAPNSINLLIKSEQPVAAAQQVTDGIYLINTLDQLNQLAPGDFEAENLRLYTGLAGWAPGQLESELIRGDWYLWHTSAESVFSPEPGMLWDELIQIVSAQWVKRSWPDFGQSVISNGNML